MRVTTACLGSPGWRSQTAWMRSSKCGRCVDYFGNCSLRTISQSRPSCRPRRAQQGAGLGLLPQDAVDWALPMQGFPMTDAKPFASLTPDHILDAVEDAGLPLRWQTCLP